jgi:hypothetical protein
MIVVVVIAASSHHFHARPHLATIALMALTMAWLCDIEAGRASLARLAWLAPVLVFWTNLHGGVLGGLATVIFAAMGWVLISIFGRGPVKSLRHVVILGLICLALGVMLLVNPYGVAMPRAWLAIMAMPLPDLIQEHRPLSALRPEGVIVVLLAAGYLWLLADVLFGRRTALPRTEYPVLRTPRSTFSGSAGASPSHSAGASPSRSAGVSACRIRITWLLPLVWLVLATLRVRHAPLFAITAGISLADMLPHTRMWSVVSSQWSVVSGQQRATNGGSRSKGPDASLLVSIGLVFAALTLQLLQVPCPLIGRGWARLDAEFWPVGIVPELREVERQSPGARILNTLDYGGFITFHAPSLKTFIDDRCELFGTEFLAAYAAAERNRPGWFESQGGEYDVDYALVRADSPFDVYLDKFVGPCSAKGWSLVKRTPTAVLYRRHD